MNMMEYKKSNPILPILAILLGIALIAGIFLIPEDLFTQKPEENASPLNQYDFVGCKISVVIEANNQNYGAVAYLTESEVSRFLSILETAKLAEAADHFGVFGGMPNNNSISLATGDNVKLYYYDMGDLLESEAFGYLVIDGTAYECHTYLNGLDEWRRNTYRDFQELRTASTLTQKSLSRITNLRLIDLNNADTIEADAFRGCSSLLQVRLPKWLQSVGSGAFKDCANLKEVFFCGEADNVDLVLEPGIFDSGVTIYGPVGGTAEACAKSEGLTFLPLPETIPPMT